MRTGRYSCLTLLSAGLAVCVGCASHTQTVLVLPELPAPPVRNSFTAPAPPVVNNGNDFAFETAAMGIDLEAVTHSDKVAAIIAQAEERFRIGQAQLRSGDARAARLEFDRAIDILLDTPADTWDHQRIEQKCEELVELISSLEAENGSRTPELTEAAPHADEVDSTVIASDSPVKLDAPPVLPPSELPLEMNGTVLKWIRYFSSENGKKILVSGLRRQGRYRSMIQRILDEEGLPQELIYLAQAESMFFPRALSNKKAAGIWQFMDYRGREYGLWRTSDFDERLDPELATRAAARHLRDLFEEYGDWYLSMVAYNGGPRRVERATRRTGQADFWEFHKQKAIPRETRDFVPMILAITIMAKRPADYGLEEVVADPPLEYSTIHVHTATHLGMIADILGRPLNEIRELNPAVLKDVVPAGRSVHVPPGQGGLVMSALEMVPPAKRDSWRVHRVGPGQSLSEIAKLYRTSEESLRLANGDSCDLAQAGDLMVVPVSYSGLKDSGRATSTRSTNSRSRSSSKSRQSRGRVKSAAASLRATRPRLSVAQP